MLCIVVKRHCTVVTDVLRFVGPTHGGIVDALNGLCQSSSVDLIKISTVQSIRPCVSANLSTVHMYIGSD